MNYENSEASKVPNFEFLVWLIKVMQLTRFKKTITLLLIMSKKYKIDKLFNFVRITHLLSKNFKVIFIIDRHVVFSLQNLALFNENYPDANTTNNASPIGFCLFRKIITIKNENLNSCRLFCRSFRWSRSLLCSLWRGKIRGMIARRGYFVGIMNYKITKQRHFDCMSIVTCPFKLLYSDFTFIYINIIFI